GCHGIGQRYHERKIPQYGCIDPQQPRELDMVSLPPYVVEPPDELTVSVRPEVPDLISTVTVQADGIIDLGFSGDVYVAGLTLEQVETRIAQHLMARAGASRPSKPYEGSVRLASSSNTSKSYYVLGAVTTQGRFPITGNETVLDAILTAGLRSHSLPEKSYLVRPHPAGGSDQVLKIDWFGIKDRGDTLTNYQVLPGDRIIVPGGKPPGLLQSLIGGGWAAGETPSPAKPDPPRGAPPRPASQP